MSNNPENCTYQCFITSSQNKELSIFLSPVQIFCCDEEVPFETFLHGTSKSPEKYLVQVQMERHSKQSRDYYDYYDTHRDGYGQNSYHEDSYCCPPVVDPLLFTALLAGIAGATQWLRPVIKMALGRRRKRSLPDYRLILIHGRAHDLQ